MYVDVCLPSVRERKRKEEKGRKEERKKENTNGVSFRLNRVLTSISISLYQSFWLFQRNVNTYRLRLVNRRSVLLGGLAVPIPLSRGEALSVASGDKLPDEISSMLCKRSWEEEEDLLSSSTVSWGDGGSRVLSSCSDCESNCDSAINAKANQAGKRRIDATTIACLILINVLFRR